MVLSETRGLWLSSIVRGGIGLRRRLSARRHEKPDNVTGYFTLETERLKNPTATARNGSPGMERTLSQRRSSCLLFQMFGVETYLLLPNDQRDRGNLPRQSQAGHRGLPALSEQILVEIVQRSSSRAGLHRRTLKNIFEVVVVVLI